MITWVIIPAFNEAKNLGALLDELRKMNLSVLVVDDGSCDNTYSLIQEKATIAIKNEKNLGKGLSLNKGIQYLLAHETFDYVITMDADNQHSPADIPAFLEEAARGEAFVIGNRMRKPVGMPRIRVWTNKFMSWFISRIIKQKVPDTQCGYRLIKKEVLKKINCEARKFEIESEFLFQAAKNGVLIRSIPIQSIYTRHHASHINPVSDTIRFILFLFKLKR